MNITFTVFDLCSNVRPRVELWGIQNDEKRAGKGRAQGSIQTAIASGTPLVGILLYVEQGLNVGMIEKHGAGLMQSKHDIQSTEIRQNVEKILGDPSYKKNMMKLSEYQNRVDGVRNSVDVIIG